MHGTCAVSLISARACNNARGCERTIRDVRVDGVDHWYALFQLVGSSTILQNDQTVALVAGNVVLIDSARPLISSMERTNSGCLCSCRADHWCSISASSQTVPFSLTGEPVASSANSFKKRLKMRIQCLRRSAPIPRICSWPSMICLERFRLSPMRPLPAVRTSCSNVSATSSRTASLILVSVPAEWQMRWGSRCATYRSSLRLATLPAAKPYSRFAWITRRVSCAAAQ